MKLLRFYLRLLAAALSRHRRFIIVLGVVGFITASFLSLTFKQIVSPAGDYLTKGLKGEFTEGLIGKVRVLNPLFVNNEAERDVIGLIYRGLTKIDSKGFPQPDLAESWEIKNNDLEYVFNLKKDVYWHDGGKFSADDVIYTIKTAQDPNFNTFLKDSFKDVSVEKIEDYKIKFTLKEPLAPFLNILTVGILPKHVDLTKFKPIGTGFFQVKALNDDQLVLTNRDFELNFKFYPTIEVAEVALKLGEIEALGGLDPNEAKKFSRWPNLRIYQHPSFRRYSALFFNTKASLFSDKSIRSAFSYAVPYEEIVKEVYPEASDSVTPFLRASPISPNSWLGLVNTKKISTDLDRSKAVLDKAGWKEVEGRREKDGHQLKFEILTLKDPLFTQTAAKLSKAYSKLGVEVKVSAISSAEIKDRGLKKDFQAILTTQEVPSDPDQYSLWHTTQISGGNITSLASAKVDKFLEDGRKVLDKEERKEKYLEFQKMLLEEAPAVWLYYLPYSYVAAPKVRGITLENLNVPHDRFDSIENWKIDRKFP